MSSRGTRLGIDFGTSSTVTTLRTRDGQIRPLQFGETPVLPSAVCLDSAGTLLVGRDALHAGRVRPESFEPNPKLRINDGSVLLGETELPIVDLIGAVLGRVRGEAERVTGETIRSATLTCPAAWGPLRRDLLRAAAATAGLDAPNLVAEPVAAAAYFVHILGRQVSEGQCVVVYDFGAGTFDASVVARSGDGFTVLAEEGIQDAGGLDIDASVVAFFGATYGSRDPEAWQRLTHPTSGSDRRAARHFWDDVRTGKEMLSRATSTAVFVPHLEVDAILNREQLEHLARPLLMRTVAATTATMRSAGIGPDAVAGVFLVGGSSRIPLVATLLHQKVGIAPTVLEHPELVVAGGSLLVPGGASDSGDRRSAAEPAGPAPSFSVPTGTAWPPMAGSGRPSDGTEATLGPTVTGHDPVRATTGGVSASAASGVASVDGTAMTDPPTVREPARAPTTGHVATAVSPVASTIRPVGDIGTASTEHRSIQPNVDPHNVQHVNARQKLARVLSTMCVVLAAFPALFLLLEPGYDDYGEVDALGDYLHDFDGANIWPWCVRYLLLAGVVSVAVALLRHFGQVQIFEAIFHRYLVRLLALVGVSLVIWRYRSLTFADAALQPAAHLVAGAAGVFLVGAFIATSTRMRRTSLAWPVEIGGWGLCLIGIAIQTLMLVAPWETWSAGSGTIYPELGVATRLGSAAVAVMFVATGTLVGYVASAVRRTSSTVRISMLAFAGSTFSSIIIVTFFAPSDPGYSNDPTTYVWLWLGVPAAVTLVCFIGILLVAASIQRPPQGTATSA